MKLTIAMIFALVLCGGSLMARASIVHKREATRIALMQAEAAQHTPAKESEKLAMSGIDLRIGSRLHRIASKSHAK
jgi:Flp pilus assembly protein CpaB